MSKTFPCCIANAAGCACSCGQTDADVLLREVLDGALQYMKETETAARRSCGYPKYLERCLEHQISACVKESNPTDLPPGVCPAPQSENQSPPGRLHPVVGCEPSNGEKP